MQSIYGEELSTDDIMVMQIEQDCHEDFMDDNHNECDRSECGFCSPEQRAHCNRVEDEQSQISFDDDF